MSIHINIKLLSAPTARWHRAKTPSISQRIYSFPPRYWTAARKDLQLPRIVAYYFHDWNVISVVESYLLIELIMDGFAHLVWPYLVVSWYMENYSGYDPVYCDIRFATVVADGIHPLPVFFVMA